ncbi:ATP-binding cassette domain-containing protein [Tomitella fengzijianii]|uniref:ATP-binding cassette domain-containing protein n=1 Tax=Tomitella fengzijianii TaxID=2597660 RepID=A0A516X5I6_9ACTN|nr:ATP-binding cassette domain-containing protein [Tomitella fengzijianii]QDQ98326.1 ATP-binding cassette domain-containing protein [Tomitella fengzijianii]
MTASVRVAQAAIEVDGLRKSFDGTMVLDGIGFTVPAGTVYALLGPNGAGKTTLVRILTTLITADAGSSRVLGHDVSREPGAIRRSIGVTGQFSAVDELLTGRENLQLMADLNHLPRARGRSVADGLLRRFDLADAADRSSRTYSGGMQRRLDLAMTLVGAPGVVFLDEPSTGLDPRSRRALWDEVRALVRDGVTILLTTQYLDEADELADRIGVLDRGQLIAEGTPAQLKTLVPGGRVVATFADGRALAAAAREFPDATCDAESGTLTIPHSGALAALQWVIARLDARGASAVEVRTPDLDDVFLALTGPARDDTATPAEQKNTTGDHTEETAR